MIAATFVWPSPPLMGDTMGRAHLFNRQFDARPDRIDFRDLPYRPRLVSLPDKYPTDQLIRDFFPYYAPLVLDQGKEGACTGFGLAAVVNYLRWELGVRAWIDNGRVNTPPTPELVSAMMFYQNARLYDEWRGQDYEGSSCRGAMKGFHKHGVCTVVYWPNFEKDKKNNDKPGTARMGWEANAPLSPLGAYYRIDGRSIVDMQSAIFETGAVYVSADVHDGWDRIATNCATLEAATIEPQQKEEVGGHAFALVGYTADGFIVQNSWGPSWGYHGFAVLAYEDWIRNGNDAWTLALGAPMRVRLEGVTGNDKTHPMQRRVFRSPGARSDISLDERLRAVGVLRARAGGDKSKVSPWINGEEMYRSIFIGHNGKADRELVSVNSGEDAVSLVIRKAVDDAATARFDHIAIYDHGGLNARGDGVNRARILGPWLEANGILPIFVIWQTGFLESAADILKIGMEKLGVPAKTMEGWLLDKINNIKDRAFEVFARETGVKAIWENMKSRADGASAQGGGLMIAAQELGKAARLPNIHLLGHSAGAIMQGHFLSAMKAKGLTADTVHLWAPACSVPFATKNYGKAFVNGTVDPKKTFIGVLSDENEVSDPCVPVLYSKSLLYLVSRALETEHKTPILGLQRIQSLAMAADDVFQDGYEDQLRAWYKASKGIVLDPPIKKTEVPIRREQNKFETIDAGHGSFDNNVDVVNLAIERMLGKKPPVPVTDLRGF